ncbi:MAG TPA: glycosyltransferase family 2 protein [Ignavibacteria bacterium]|nr:glycosyl transferase family 2 [Bacteroidota bacterium]HRI85138.1 glycosyltransferase family 2 protein [Ignavibacteria bacterium]HRJ98977.1 glycosyltransferase family 2 protein [Ignavibacteria bacterium]
MNIESLILAAYIISLSILFFFGSHGFNMVYYYFKTFGKRTVDLDVSEFYMEEYPVVTVQIPLYNEQYVITRLIDSVLRMDYPKDKLEVQILDDSTDETTQIIKDHIKKYEDTGFDIKHIHRTNREGFKAGALKAGLETARGEFVAVFDADFIPRKKFLKRTIPYFYKEEKLGLVQTRWEHLNREFSLMTKTQAIALDGHFVIEQAVRNRAGFFINFNGTGGVWRKECIFDAGNWEADTLTEDLDLSYRAQMKGWKFRYLVNFTSPAELPSDIGALKSQQFRWTKGAIETAKKVYPKVLRSDMSLKLKFQSFIHLYSNLAYPFILMAALLNLPVMLIKLTGEYDTVFKFMSLFIFAFISSFMFYLYSQKDVYPDWQKRIIYFPVFLAGSMGFSVNNTKAVFEGLLDKKSEFVRTPKYQIMNKKDSWEGKKYVNKKLSFTTYIEALLAVYCFAGVVIAVATAQVAAIPFQLMFCGGFSLISYLSIRQVIIANRSNKRKLVLDAK